MKKWKQNRSKVDVLICDGRRNSTSQWLPYSKRNRFKFIWNQSGRMEVRQEPSTAAYDLRLMTVSTRSASTKNVTRGEWTKKVETSTQYLFSATKGSRCEDPLGPAWLDGTTCWLPPSTSKAAGKDLLYQYICWNWHGWVEQFFFSSS